MGDYDSPALIRWYFTGMRVSMDKRWRGKGGRLVQVRRSSLATNLSTRRGRGDRQCWFKKGEGRAGNTDRKVYEHVEPTEGRQGKRRKNDEAIPATNAPARPSSPTPRVTPSLPCSPFQPARTAVGVAYIHVNKKPTFPTTTHPHPFPHPCLLSRKDREFTSR